MKVMSLFLFFILHSWLICHRYPIPLFTFDFLMSLGIAIIHNERNPINILSHVPARLIVIPLMTMLSSPLYWEWGVQLPWEVLTALWHRQLSKSAQRNQLCHSWPTGRALPRQITHTRLLLNLDCLLNSKCISRERPPSTTPLINLSS
jgi:hypothetical protein